MSNLKSSSSWHLLLRKPLGAALNLLRRYPALYFSALSLVKRAPRAYVFLHRLLVQQSWHVHTADKATLDAIEIKNLNDDTHLNQRCSPELPSLALGSGPVAVAERRLLRALLNASRQ